MNMIITTIDTVYGHIVSVSTRSVMHVHGVFSLKEPETSNFIFGTPTVSESAKTGKSETSTTFKTVSEVLETKDVSEGTVTPVKNMVMYTASSDVPVYKNPTIEFDTKIGSIPYGEMVMMLDVRGRFHQIVWNTVTGWVLKDDLVDRAAHIHPKFILGEENLHDKSNTLHVRTVLEDTFGIGRSEFPLQAGEYVLYKLLEKDIKIEWPETRPRAPGLWHRILRGVPKIHIGVVPKEGAVMEYIFDGETGHLAYVEEVLSDDTISISEVDYPDSGTYSERILTKEEWKELKPVFIEAQ